MCPSLTSNSDYYSDAPVDWIKKTLEASCHFSLECFLSESRKGSSVSLPTCRGPASMPPRRATATMHNHAAAVSLSGTRGCAISAPSYLSGLFIQNKASRIPFCTVLARSGTVRSSWENRKWTIIKHHSNFRKLILSGGGCGCRAESDSARLILRSEHLQSSSIKEWANFHIFLYMHKNLFADV